jgi:peptidoglycan hydrolase-like protein with peptidoglycan-binding domain
MNSAKTITVNFALVAATTTIVNIAAPITTITQSVNCPAGFTCTPSIGAGASTGISSNLLSLSFGTSNSNVVALQNLLIQYGYLRSGLNTGYYGALTQAAVNAYRAATTVSAVQSAPTGMIITPTIGGSFTRTLKIGSTGADVKALQVFLNTHGFTIATSGNGSLGHETTYYGPATAAAVSRFQVAHSAEILAPYGLTQGTGNFGTGTMKVVNALK